MAEIVLDIKIESEESLDDDLKEFKNVLMSYAMTALFSVQDAMFNSLHEHINKDVYDVYHPTDYPRRKDNPQFGTPLDDVLNYGSLIGPFNKIYASGDFSLHGGISYDPRGEHCGTTADLDPDSKYYDADNPKPLKPNPVHENDLIRRIETGEGYDWKVPKVVYKGRPFWQNFVKEMIEGGQIAVAFRYDMISHGVDVEMTYDEVEREPQDGDY